MGPLGKKFLQGSLLESKRTLLFLFSVVCFFCCSVVFPFSSMAMAEELAMTFIRSQLNVSRHLIAGAVLVAVGLLSSACAKNGGGDSAPPPTPTAQTTVPPQAPAPPNPTPTPGTTGGGELNGGSGHSSQTGPSGSAGGSAPVVAVPSTGGSDPVVISYDPTGMVPNEIFSSTAMQGSGVGSAMYERADDDGNVLYYSGSGLDDLHARLQALADSVQDPAQKEANDSLARELGPTRFRADFRKREITVWITRFEDGRRIETRLSGPMSNKLTARLGTINGSNGSRSANKNTKNNKNNRNTDNRNTGDNGSSLQSPGLAVEAACMDEGGGCRAMHVKVMDRQRGRARTAHVIARETPTYIHTKGNGPGVARNPEYDRLINILINTSRISQVSQNGRGLHLPTYDVVDKVTLATSETINGSSEFAIRMRLLLGPTVVRPQAREEFIVWWGPLVKPADEQVMNLEINANVERTQESIGDTIRETRLVRNDGFGNLQLEVVVRHSTLGSMEDRFILTVARIHKPVRDLVLR